MPVHLLLSHIFLNSCLFFHQMFRISLYASFCFVADGSGGKMFAMATPCSCVMGCKLMVRILVDCEFI